MGHTPGDLIFVLDQVQHPYFQRTGDDLHTTISITLQDSLIGFTRTFKHLDDHDVVIRKTDVTYCSEIFVVKGEGMPRKDTSSKGDLYVTLNIEFPRDFTPAQKEKIKAALEMK